MKSENISFHEVIEIVKNQNITENDVYKLIEFYMKTSSKAKRIYDLIKKDQQTKHPFHY